MKLDDFQFLPQKITSQDPAQLAAQFEAAFRSAEAQGAKKVVYCFVAEQPLPRVKGASRVLYIGKTDKSLETRWACNAKRLGNGRNVKFYQYVLKNFGAVSIGFLKSEDPRADEERLFQEYFSAHLEYPPKSRRAG